MKEFAVPFQVTFSDIFFVKAETAEEAQTKFWQMLKDEAEKFEESFSATLALNEASVELYDEVTECPE